MRCCVVTMLTALLANRPGYAQTSSDGSTDPITVDTELHDRVVELESEVASLRTQSRDDWLTQERADEIRELVANVIADADERVAMFDQSVTAGYDDHFFLASTDGNFRLEISGQLQMRFVYNHLDDSEDSDRSGFENRRTKLKFRGHIVDPRFSYSVSTAFDDDSGTFKLNDAYVAYEVSDEFAVRAGRFRSPLLREEDVSSKRQLLAERSLVARAFNQDRTTGVAIQYEQQAFRIHGAFMDVTREGSEDQSYIASARGEILLSGAWKQLKDFTSFRFDEPTIALGAGILFQEEDFKDPDEDDAQLLRWTADVSMEFGGANLFAAIVGNHMEEEDHDSLDQLGFVVQGGIFFTDDSELFAQYVWGDSDEAAADLSVLTVGINHYLAEHALKWTLDVGYAFSEVSDLWASGSAGYREDASGDDGQVVVRMQWQLLF